MKPLKLSAPLAAALLLVACEPVDHENPYSRYHRPQYYGMAGVPKPVEKPSPSPSLSSPVTYDLQGGTEPTSLLEGGGSLVLYDGTAKFEQRAIKAALSRTLSGVEPTAAPGFGYPNGTYYYQQTGTSTPSFELERMGPALGLKESDFGAWAQIDINNGDLTNSGFYAGGLSASKLASTRGQTGPAVYVGSYIGRLHNGDATSAVSGSMLVQADHTNNTVSVIFTSGRLATRNLLILSGQISSDNYTASYGASGVQCTVKGRTYRDSGSAETTGTLSGSLGGAGEFNGAFGART